MNKKILTSVVVLGGLLFGGDVFAGDYVNIEGEGLCEMVLPANTIKKNRYEDFEFMYSDKSIFFNEEDEYIGFDKLLKKIRSVLPDAVITSYKYDIEDEMMLFNIDTKLQKDLLGLIGVEYTGYRGDSDISENLADEFKSSKEYLDCKDMAIKSAMKNAMDKAKIFKAKIVYSPNYGYDRIYKIDDGKIRYYSNMKYKAVAD